MAGFCLWEALHWRIGYPERNPRFPPMVHLQPLSWAPRWGLLLALLALGWNHPVAAASPQGDNIGHQRHKHKHGHPVPSAPDAKRFHTNRDGAELPLPGEEDAFFFVVFGDRTGGPASGVSVLADAVRDTNLLHPDFVFTVGDLVEGANQTGRWLAQAFEYKGIMNELLCPWFPVAGNHDIYWKGPDAPQGQHEANYEMHFGPLWYAFEHKNCFFIALYTDEGNPQTGEKDFYKSAAQTMSPEQLQWLQETLQKAKGADHVFVFVHHPRWIGANYGNDWERVHAELVKAGNVTAVFGGHIHYMRSDPKDGIEYVTLATTGGGQDGVVPEAGWLHHFNVVTVRKDQVSLAAIPVGQVLDVREITQEVITQTYLLAIEPPKIEPRLELHTDKAHEANLTVTFRNPSDRPIDVEIGLESEDSRWLFAPDHTHQRLQPGQTMRYQARTFRVANSLDPFYRPARVRVSMDYLMPGCRYSIPDILAEVPTQTHIEAPPIPEYETALDLRDRKQFLGIPHHELALPDGPFSLETWVFPESLQDCGIIAKTEESEWGLHLTGKAPKFYLHVGGQYAIAYNPEARLETGLWYHLAADFDGQTLRLYLNGKEVANTPASGQRKPNLYPLIIGGDIHQSGRMHKPFKGFLDGVHIATGALHAGQAFEPPARPTPTPNTLLLLNMDGLQGSWLFDESPLGKHPYARGLIQLDVMPNR